MVLGVAFVAVGIVGVTVSGGHPVVGPEGGELFGVRGVNALHNVAHLLIGTVLIVGAAAGVQVARRTNTVVGVGYALLGLVGPIVSTTSWNVLALNGAAHVVHVLAALVLVGVGVLADSPVIRARSPQRPLRRNHGVA
ncbi:DUF4383 domain-containing protein [Hoyosella sp. G463]|uniref:DUF4383 domain-containing protein n=2 Tax=Lolliginicoccus lacisalsi TaxID=2742202 RepID=A0A927JAS7_9ACTN|nr:DUF4383 domain-containing protein [Lolliginicoccus lacisalsi]MBD8505720.1 DUF4383 domain-containing protein [Lolliginicoccus lacisalsi]